MLAAFEPLPRSRRLHPELHPPGDARRTTRAEAAREIYGDDRVTVVPRLADAIDQATASRRVRASGASIGSGAVLVTGSVVTVGEARTMLKGRG